MTKEELGQLILSSERQLYATAKTILADDQDCADANTGINCKSIFKNTYVEEGSLRKDMADTNTDQRVL